MADHTEEEDDHLRALIRAHLRDFGEVGKDWLKLDEAAAELGYSRDQVRAMAAPIKKSIEDAMGALGSGDVAVWEDEPRRPRVRTIERLPVESQPLNSYEDRMRGIDADLRMLRDYCLLTDETKPHGLAIKFPNIFLSAIYHQEQALKLHMAVGEALFELDRVKRFFKRVGDVLRDRLGEDQAELRDSILGDFDNIVDEFMGRGRNVDS